MIDEPPTNAPDATAAWVYAAVASRGIEHGVVYRETDDPAAWLAQLQSLGWTTSEAYEAPYLPPIDPT